MLYDQISANKQKTWFLISLFSVLIVLLGWALGTWTGDAKNGIYLAAIVSVVMSLIGYFQGDTIALAASGAQAIEKKDHPIFEFPDLPRTYILFAIFSLFCQLY